MLKTQHQNRIAEYPVNRFPKNRAELYNKTIMQPSSFNEPNSSAGTTPQPAGSGLPNVPQPSVSASAWLAATDPSSASAPKAQQSVAPAPGPELADDGDLIEKEWVSQVKRIVAATANDPYELNVQFTRLKAEYMQKRYGKRIKLED